MVQGQGNGTVMYLISSFAEPSSSKRRNTVSSLEISDILRVSPFSLENCGVFFSSFGTLIGRSELGGGYLV
jgi:hypothetical protein